MFDPKRMADRILGFGDIILVEKAQSVVDENKAFEIEKRIQQNKFDFEDFKCKFSKLRK